MAFGVAILAISVPLAVQQAVHDQLLYLCTSGRRSTLPLAARTLVAASGPLLYASVAGWLLVAAAGVCLFHRRSRAWAATLGMAGFLAVLVATWRICQIGS